MVLHVSSPAFNEGDRIPIKYTCEGQDVSPPIVWSEPPVGTQSLVLILEDPEDSTAPGGVFTHWVLFNIPSDTCEIAGDISTQAELFNSALQGKNDFGRIGYCGPCPNGSGPHRYRFTLYALNCSLDLNVGASKKQVLDGIQGHILAQGELTGIY